MSEKKHQLFAVTDFVCDAGFIEGFFQQNNVRWLEYGEEETKDGKKHFQMVIYFETLRTLTSVIKKLKPRHVEIARGSIVENHNYVTKCGIVTTYGVQPQQGKRKDIEEIFQDLRNGASVISVAEHNPLKWCMYRKAFEAYKQEIEPKRDWVTEVLIFQGRAGTGKTRKAIEMGGVICNISGDPKNPFINGYNGEDVVIFDEFDEDSCSRTAMMTITDRYPYNINIKGGSRNWKPRIIIFTTNDDARAWYNGAESWLRRITRIDRFEKENGC